MDAKQAVAIAKKHFQDIFAEDSIAPPVLEEIWFDHSEKVWNITLRMQRRTASAADALGLNTLRDLKVVRVSDEDGTPLSIRNQVLGAA